MYTQASVPLYSYWSIMSFIHTDSLDILATCSDRRSVHKSTVFLLRKRRGKPLCTGSEQETFAQAQRRKSLRLWRENLRACAKEKTSVLTWKENFCTSAEAKTFAHAQKRKPQERLWRGNLCAGAEVRTWCRHIRRKSLHRGRRESPCRASYSAAWLAARGSGPSTTSVGSSLVRGMMLRYFNLLAIA
jgi:hypothetical protein